MATYTTTEVRALTCDMETDCLAPVTHIDNRGFTYCKRHGVMRQYDVPCRQLRAWEKRELERNGSIYYDTAYTFKEHLRVFYPEEYARRFNAQPD